MGQGMDEQMDNRERIGQVGRWLNGNTERWVVDGWVDGWTNGWMMDGQMNDEWMDDG